MSVTYLDAIRPVSHVWCAERGLLIRWRCCCGARWEMPPTAARIVCPACRLDLEPRADHAAA